jgi:hypothetical protein
MFLNAGYLHIFMMMLSCRMWIGIKKLISLVGMAKQVGASATSILKEDN